MGKAWRDIQLPMVIARQELAHPAAKGGRAASDIHYGIEYLALEHAHQFALGVFELVVQATQYSPGRVGIVVLYKRARDVHLTVPLGLPGFHKEAAGIRKHRRFNETHAWKAGVVHFHSTPPSCRSRFSKYWP